MSCLCLCLYLNIEMQQQKSCNYDTRAQQIDKSYGRLFKQFVSDCGAHSFCSVCMEKGANALQKQFYFSSVFFFFFHQIPSNLHKSYSTCRSRRFERVWLGRSSLLALFLAWLFVWLSQPTFDGRLRVRERRISHAR